jgi:hypothetical protein
LSATNPRPFRPSSIPGTLEAQEVKFVGLNRTLPSLMHTPIFEWYIARLVVKNGRENTLVKMKLEYVFKTRTPL